MHVKQIIGSICWGPTIISAQEQNKNPEEDNGVVAMQSQV